MLQPHNETLLRKEILSCLFRLLLLCQILVTACTLSEGSWITQDCDDSYVLIGWKAPVLTVMYWLAGKFQYWQVCTDWLESSSTDRYVLIGWKAPVLTGMYWLAGKLQYWQIN